MRLSTNFPRYEFERSQTATRKGIVNRMNKKQLGAAILLCSMVLQPVRNHFGPTIVTSGFRCKELNELIGGSDDSQHQKGEASDIVIPGVPPLTVARWIRDNVPQFDQLILEFYDPTDITAGWVHVSYTEGKNRREVLTAELVTDDKGKTKVDYTRGLP